MEMRSGAITNGAKENKIQSWGLMCLAFSAVFKRVWACLPVLADDESSVSRKWLRFFFSIIMERISFFRFASFYSLLVVDRGSLGLAEVIFNQDFCGPPPQLVLLLNKV